MSESRRLTAAVIRVFEVPMIRLSMLCSLLFATTIVYAATIHVPADQPTIQAGINAAQNGDTVLVAPGTYFENINFTGKAITVKSANGYKVTIIDGGHANSVVTFNAGETLASVLHGFTIQNGNSSFEGGGVYVYNASPTVSGNLVQNNTAAGFGAGISVHFSSALVQGNAVAYNSQTPGDSGGGGGGISALGAGAAQIISNIIQNNSWTFGEGGGIELDATRPTVKNNIIRGNSGNSRGGGIDLTNYSDALIVQNLIYDNRATQGSGIYFGVSDGDGGPLFVNNTIVGTISSSQGSAVYADGFYDQVQLFNNVMIGASGTSAVYCGTYGQNPPTFTNNDAFSPNGSGLQGTCAAQSNTNGNISANPRFVGKTNFQLKAVSPAIDAGDNSAPDLPTLDLSGKPRIVDGDGDGDAIIDMGAYEYQPPAQEALTPARP